MRVETDLNEGGETDLNEGAVVVNDLLLLLLHVVDDLVEGEQLL